MKRLLLAAGVIALSTPALRTHAQSCAPVLDGLVAWWQGENNAQDSIGAHHGTLLNGAGFATAIGQGFSFDGIDDTVDIPYNPALFGLTQGTLEMWIRIPDLAQNTARLFAIAKTGLPFPNSDQWTLDYRAGGALQVTCVSAGSLQMSVLTPDTSIADTGFHHVAVVAGSGALQVFIDGVVQSLTVSGGSAGSRFFGHAPTADNMKIGAIQRNALFADGAKVIDEVSVYDRPLTAAEIQGISAAGTAGKCVDPLFITAAALPEAVLGVAYSKTLAASLGTPPYTFTISSGTPPAGLTLSSGGVLNGTPTAAGDYSFTVRLEDNASPKRSAARTFSLRVRAYTGTSYTWNNSSGNWSDPSRWIPNGVPGANDEANLNGGEVTVSAVTDVAAFNLNGATLRGDAMLTVTALMNWTAGEMVDGGTTRIASAAALYIGGPASKGFRQPRVLENFGHAYWSGGNLYGYFDSSIHNRPGGVFEIRTAAILTAQGSGQFFNNEGLLRKTTINTPEQVIEWPVRNTGTMEVQNGSLRMDRPFNNSGSLTLGGGTAIAARAGGTNSGVMNAAAGAVVELGGAYRLNAGSIIAGGGVVRIGDQVYVSGNASVANLDFYGELDGPGTLTVSNIMNWTAGRIVTGLTLNIDIGATLNLAGLDGKTLYNTCVLNNAGSIYWTGNGRITGYGDATINNLASGRFEIQNDSGFDQQGPGEILNNAGLIRKTVASGPTTCGFILNNSATGTLDVQSGTVVFNGFGASAVLNNSGAITLGNGSVVVSGDYAPAAGASLNIVLSGPTPVSLFGQLRVTGNAALNGALHVSLADGFAPGVGDTFLVVSSGTRSGGFSSTSGLNLGGGLLLALSYPPQGTLLTTVMLGITPPTLPQGYAGAAYSQTLNGANGVPPYGFAVTGGTLPPGLGLSPAGVLSGTPPTAGTFNFTVQMTDGTANFATANYTMQVLSCTLGGLFENLRAQWRADGNALDARGTSHGTLQNGATFAAGVTGQAFALDGVNDFVEIPDSPGVSITGAIAVAVWVRPNSISGDSEILTKYDSSVGSGASRQTSYVVQQHDGILDWQVYVNGNSSRGILTTLPALGVGVFHHVVCTFDPATQAMAIYVDGVAQPTSLIGGSVTVSAIMDSTTPVRLGTIMPSSGVPINFFSGRIDEVGLFDRALSASEVTTLYNHPGSSCLDAPEFTTLSTLPNCRVGTPYWQALTALLGHTPYSFALTSGALPAGLTFSSGGLFSGTPLLSGATTFTVTLTDALGNSAQREFTISINPQLPCVTIDGAWARWPGESDAVETMNGFNGALFNGATYTPGVVGQAFLFDGVDDYFQASVPYLPGNGGPSSDLSVTLELWMRMDAPAPGSGSWVAGYSGLGLAVGSDQKLALSGASGQGPVLEVGRWYHVAGIYEAGYARLYVDGVQVVVISSGIGAASGSFYMGQSSANSMPFRGAVDEPTLFHRALSAAEVKSIYDAGGSGKCRSMNNTVANATCEVIATSSDPQVKVRGLGFNLQNEPVVAWMDNGGVTWAAHANGSWSANQIRPVRGVGGGLGFAMREDGVPFFSYAAPDVYIGNDSYVVGLSLVNGAVEPNGPGNRLYVPSQGGSSALAFAPGTTTPDWVFWGDSLGVYNGFAQPIATGLGGYDFAINGNGVHALIANNGGSVQFSRTTGIIDGPTLVQNISGNNVACTVDANNVFHALVSRLNSSSDGANGKMTYARSANGTNWTFTDLGPGVEFKRSRAVAITMDNVGFPAMAYLRADKLWYATYDNGHWTQFAVGSYTGYAEQQAPHLGSEIFRLAFDRTGKPALCVLEPGTLNILLCRPTGLLLAINPPGGTQLPTATIGDPYTAPITQLYSSPAMNYQLAYGALPTGLEVSADGSINGVPMQDGSFAFHVRAFDGNGRSALVYLRLQVNLRPPRFTLIPLSREMDWGKPLWLAAQTDIPAEFQWYFNKQPLPGETGDVLFRPEFSHSHAGTYVVRARNGAGDIWSPPADVRLIQAPAARDGVSLNLPGPPKGLQTIKKRFDVQFPTQPGRRYRLERAANDRLDGQWVTVDSFRAKDYTATYTDDQVENTEQRFIQVVEEPPDQAGAYTASDTESFVPLDGSNQPLDGQAVNRDANGEVAAIEFRPGRKNVAKGMGLIVRFPDGAQIIENNGQTILKARHILFLFGPDSPLQFSEVLEVNSPAAQELIAGPISVAQIETLLGRAAGAGLPMTAFTLFNLQLTRGTFDGSRIGGARFQFISSGGLTLPLPQTSGDYPDLTLEVAPQGGIRIPFHGTFGLVDDTSSPATLTVPAARPIVLELRPDGHVALEGHADAEFANGPKFGVDFAFSDPDYRLKLSAARLSLPPLMKATAILPDCGVLPDSTADAALDPVALRLDFAECAAANFCALNVSDATRPADPQPTDSPAIEPGAAAELEMWTCIALANGFGDALVQIETMARRSSRGASASDDLFAGARALAMLVRLQQTRGSSSPSPDLAAATTEAAAALVRQFKTIPCDDLTPATFIGALSNLFQGVPILQQLSNPYESQLRGAAADLIDCYAAVYLRRLEVTSGSEGFTIVPNSRIDKMHRYEALEHIRQLLQLRYYAQWLGIPDARAPLSQGLTQLGVRVWRELGTQLENALAANDRRTYLYLSPELLDLEVLTQSGLLPQNMQIDNLPQGGEIADLINRIFQNGPVEIATEDAYGEDLPQLRDDLKRFALLLSGIPKEVTTAPTAVERNFGNLNQRFARVIPFLGSRNSFRTRDLVSALDAGVINEETRIRFHLATASEWVGIHDQLGAVATELLKRIREDDDWSSAHQAARALLAAADRARKQANEQGATPDDAAAWRVARKACLKRAGLFCEATREIAGALWERAEDHRNASLGLRLVDMLLPGGIEVDEVAGELRYNARAHSVAGAVSGKVRLPGQGLSLELINGSFRSGGAFDVSLAGKFEVPQGSSLVTFEIPKRHPLHLALDLDRHLTLEGGLQAKLQNGMEFEAWASLSDPVYTFGAAARGIRLDVGKKVTLNLQVPDLNQLNALPGHLQPLVIDYLAASAAALEPLRNEFGQLPELPPLGSPPAFENPQVSLDVDSLLAGVRAFELLAASPAILGQATVESAAQTITNLAVSLRREVQRASARMRSAADTLLVVAPPGGETDMARDERRAKRMQALCNLRELARAFTNGLAKAYRAVAVGQAQGFDWVLNKAFIKEQLGPLQTALQNVRLDPDVQQDPAAMKKVVEIGALVQQIEIAEDISLIAEEGPALKTFVEQSRKATFARIGLNADGSIHEDGTTLAALDYSALLDAAGEIAGQEQFLQGQVSTDVRFDAAMKSLYVARRNVIVRKLHGIETTALTPPFTLPVVRQLKEFLCLTPLALETEAFAQGTGIIGPVDLLEYDATTQTLVARNKLIEEAGASLLDYLSTQAGLVAEFIAQAAGGSSEQRRVLADYVSPEMRRWHKGQTDCGCTQRLAPPVRVVAAKINQRAGFQAGFAALIRFELDTLKVEVQRGLLLTAADALDRFSEVVGLAELIDLAAAVNARNALFNELQQFVLPAPGSVTVKLVGVAEARKAWWLTQRAATVLNDAIQHEAHRGSVTFSNVLYQELTLTRNSTRSLLVELRDAFSLVPAAIDLKLPGSLVISDVHGEVTFNRQTKFIRGEFGGRLEFPDLQDSYIALDRLVLDTDGHFVFDAAAEFPVPITLPGMTSSRFTGTLHVTGQKALDDTPNGSIMLSGTGRIAQMPGEPGLAASVSYDQIIVTDSEGHPQVTWRLNVGVSGHVNLRFGNDFFLFDASGGVATGNGGQGTSLRLGGKAGLFANRDLTLTNDNDVTPAMFHLLVEEVNLETGVSRTTAGNVETVVLHSGKLRLPALFGNIAGDLCAHSPCHSPGAETGVEVSVTTDHAITVQFNSDTHELTLSGGLEFRNVGFPIPIVPGMQAALCKAKLLFSNHELPSLTDVCGTVKLPLPGDQEAVLDLQNGRFTLGGLPTGEITLREDLHFPKIGEIELTLLGTKPNCTTGLNVQQPSPARPNVPDSARFTLSGGMRIALPLSLASSNNEAGGQGQIATEICGSLHVDVQPNALPEITFDLPTALEFSAASIQLGGAGLKIKNAMLRFENMDRAFSPTAEHPFIVKVGGSVTWEGGPEFGLQDAQMRVFDRNRLPEFTFGQLTYLRRDWVMPPAGLPIRINSATLALRNPLIPFPEKLKPTNVQVTVSAEVRIPNDPGEEPILKGAVDNLTIRFDEHGLPMADIDGFEIGIGNLQIPPIDDLGGQLRIGGLKGQSVDDIYIVGRLSGSFSTYKMAYLVAFTYKGPLGICLDLNLGPTGLTLSPTPFIISGASGGISFINSNGDPCKFENYFYTDEATGETRLKGGGFQDLVKAMSWADMRATMMRMTNFAKLFPKPPFPSLASLPGAGGGGGGAPPQGPVFAPASDGGQTAGMHTIPKPDGPVTIECPGDCPPATVNILCQPHPDQKTYPGRVILKFTAIDEATVNAAPPRGLGITEADFNLPGVTAATVAVNAARGFTNLIVTLTPPLDSALPSQIRSLLQQAQSEAISLAYKTATATVYIALRDFPAAEFYGEFVRTVGKGLPCQDLTLSVAGRGSIIGVGAIAYVEGKAVMSTSGSDGYMGILNVLGFPVGEARLFVASTDAKGLPNPSACGEVKVGFGPLDIGDVRLLLECRECVTKILGIFPAVAHGVSESLFRDMVSRVAPAIQNLPRKNRQQVIDEILQMPNDQQFSVLAGFFADLMARPPQALSANLYTVMTNAISPVLRDIDPRVVLCGEVTPKLFGFPLSPSGIRLGAQVNKEGYIGSFSFPAGFFLQPYPILPPLDEATLSWDLRARDPLFLLAGAVDGQLSPQRAGQFAQDQINYMLEHTVYAIDYELHPFGMRVADAGMRLMMPDLLNHPALTKPPRKPAWEKDPKGLPSPLEVLLAAATTNKLGNAFGWHGTTQDFFHIFPPGSPQRAVLEQRHLDLRKDYFPHGGLLGGGRLATPLILNENPTNWLALLNDMRTNDNPVEKVQVGAQLVKEHVLQTITNGEIAFYLPAPNPPVLFDPNGERLDQAAATALTAGQIIDSIKQFNPAHLTLGSIYPREYAFATGHLRGDFLGVPIGEAQFSARFAPAPGSAELATIVAVAPPESWIAKLAGGPVNLNFSLGAPPSNAIHMVFSNLLHSLSNALPNPTQADAQRLAESTFAAVASALPKASFQANLPNLPLPLAGDPRLPPAAWVWTPTVAGYSPMFDTNAPLTTLSNRVRHDGGLFAAAAFDIFPLKSAPELIIGAADGDISDLYSSGVIRVGQAELAVTATATGRPRLSGSISNITFMAPTPFEGLEFLPNASGAFDSAGNPAFVQIHGEAPAINLGPAFSLTPANGSGGFAADFIVSPAVPLPTITLTLAPARLTVPLLGSPSLLLHGNGDVNSPLIFSSRGISAQASFAPPLPGSPFLPASDSHSIDLKVGDVVLARILGLPQTSFAISGEGLRQFTLHFDASVSGPMTIEPFPGHLPQNFPSTLSSFTINPASGSLSFIFDSAGNFELIGALGNDVAGSGNFPGLKAAGARVTINNNGLSLAGTAFNGSANVSFNVTPGGVVTLTGELTVGPWTWGCIELRGPGPNGTIHASVSGDGLQLDGPLQLKMCSPWQGAGIQTFDFPSLFRNAVGETCTNFAITGRALPVGSGIPFVILEQVGFCAIASEFANSGAHMELKGRIKLNPVLEASFSGFVDSQTGVHLQLDPQSQALQILGLDFVNVTASFTGVIGQRPTLTLHGEAPWLPQAMRSFDGTLDPDQLLNLHNGAGDLSSALAFALNNVQSKIHYQPGTYSGIVKQDQPTGYWRLNDANTAANTALDSHTSTASLRHNGSYRPLGDGDLPLFQQPGAFETNQNKAVTFNGTSQCVVIGDESAFDVSGPLSIDLWFKRSSTSSSGSGKKGTLVSKGTAWYLELDEDNGKLNYITDGVSGGSLTSAGSFSDLEWHHVAAIFDSHARYLYLDGRLDNWEPAQGTLAQNDRHVLLAGREVSSVSFQAYFAGTLDEVAIFTRALSPAEVLDHYLAGGRGALRLDASLGDLTGLSGLSGIGVSGLLGADGSAALALNASATATLGANGAFGGFSLPGFSGSILIHGGDAALAFHSQLSPPPGLSGTDLNVDGLVRQNGDFNFSAAGESLTFANYFTLDNLSLTASRASGGPVSSTFAGRLIFPSFLDPNNNNSISLSGSFSPLSLRSPSDERSFTLGPGEFKLKQFTLDSSPLKLTSSGKLTPTGSGQSFGTVTFAAGEDGVSFTTTGDTGWKDARGKVPKCTRTVLGVCVEYDFKTLVDASFHPPYMRFDWNLSVSASPDTISTTVGGTFRAETRTTPNVTLEIPVNNLDIDTGVVEIDHDFQGFKKFLPKLW